MNNEPQGSSIVTLLRDLRSETSTLIQQQVELVKEEVTEKITELAANAVRVGIGAFVAYAGAIILLIGLADLVGMFLIRSGMETEMAAWLSRVLVGLVVAIIGWTLLAKAKKAIADQKIVPEQTMQTLSDNKEWAQEKIQSST